VNALSARTADGQYGLLITAEAWEQIGQLCLAAGDWETGGILIGQYTPDRKTALVTEATSAPADSHVGRSAFVRGVAGLRVLLRRRWKDKDHRYYLGEWHFHPARIVQPSFDDIEQMGRIALASNYRCKEPILMIVGRPNEHQGGRPVRVLVFPRGGPFEMDVS
jgi:integrative and conjugative element protein (TIGR02256 family)